MDKTDRLELLMILSRFEGFLMCLNEINGSKREYICAQLDHAVDLLTDEDDHKPVYTYCDEHGAFPCKECGVLHYEGCKCGVCR